MNELGQSLLDVAKQYVGPAAPLFLSRELRALELNLSSVEFTHLPSLTERARRAALHLMEGRRADEFANALASCAPRPARAAAARDHRLASDAAAKLLATGKVHGALIAYRELAQKHGDRDSYRGLANAALAVGDRETALEALREGAAACSRAGDRFGAVALLSGAAAVAPTDLAAHRRLAATLANQGDVVGACDEYARYVATLLDQPDTRRALLELTYAREMLGEQPRLLALVGRVAARGGAAAPEPPPAAQSVFVAPAQPQQTVTHALDAQLATLLPSGSPSEAAAIADSRATLLIGARDDRATAATIDAARRLLVLGKLRGASDVLLAYLGAGFRDRAAQRLLIEVEHLLGRADLAVEKCHLLARAYQLDGSGEAADEVERLGRILGGAAGAPLH